MATRHTPAPTATEILRYRSHYGVNLGGIFVLEKWLFPDMFDPSAAGDSELDAVVSAINTIGIEATRRKWQSHYSTALPASSLQHLISSHITTVRLPIGYFTLGPAFNVNTPFALSPSLIYTHTWSFVCNLILRLHGNGIGVLLALHACPGGANPDPHSGPSTGRPALWQDSDSTSHRRLAKDCLLFITRELHTRGLAPGVTGLQLCNEAISNAPGMSAWYDDVIASISAIDPTLPLYISDGGDLPSALVYMRRKNTVLPSPSPSTPPPRPTNPIIVNTHRFYNNATTTTTSSSSHRYLSTDEILDGIAAGELSELANPIHGAADVFGAGNTAMGVFIGKWSMALAAESMDGVPPERQVKLYMEFGFMQRERWQLGPVAGGSAFWNGAMGERSGARGGPWDFETQAGVYGGPVQMPGWLGWRRGEVLGRVERAVAVKARCGALAMSEHVAFWDVRQQRVRQVELERRQSEYQRLLEEQQRQERAGEGSEGDGAAAAAAAAPPPPAAPELKTYFEHWRFASGWHMGWCDAQDFCLGRVNGVVPTPAPDLSAAAATHDKVSVVEAGGDPASMAIVGADTIGFLDLWVLKRMREQGVLRGQVVCGWQWEKGFRRGVKDFETLLEVGRPDVCWGG